MDIFEQRYFNFNRKIFIFVGLWPYGTNARNIRKYLLVIALVVMSIPSLISCKVNFSDIDRAMLNLVIFSVTFQMALKVLAMNVAEDKMKGLYKNIANNWQSITDPEEEKILFEYSERGRKLGFYYFSILQVGGSLFWLLTTVPKILDLIYPLSKPRPTLYILESELFIDREKNFMVYWISDVVTALTICVASASVDSMFIVCVEHCCALYAIISHRLRSLQLKMVNNITGNKIDLYNYVVSIVKLHQVSLDFTETINVAFSLLFLFILITNLAILPLCAVTVLSTLHQPLNCLRFIITSVTLAIHLFMLFWPGQKIIDHSTDLTDDAYSNEWYELPIRTRKMLIIFMVRCTQPSLLVPGGLMLMNFETYSMILRTAVSYITVVASFR